MPEPVRLLRCTQRVPVAMTRNEVDELNLSMMLENVCRDNPDKTAIVFKDRKLTYCKLGTEIEKLAGKILSLGVKKGERVGILLCNSPEFVIAYFAILKSGSSIVPLNTMLKEEELKFILTDSDTRLLITSAMFSQLAEKIRQELPKLKEVVRVGSEESFYEGADTSGCTDALFPEASGDDIACVMYTSGTTGKPKGAMLAHNNLLSNISSVRRAFTSNLPEATMCVLPMFHAFAATACMLFPLSLGSTIVIVERFSALLVLQEISKNRVTMFAGVPPMFSVLAGTEVPEGCELSSWKVAISGGAALPVEVMEAFEKKYNVPVYEGDGPTECSPVTSVNPIGGKRKPGSIGKPLPDVQMRIIDDDGKEVPVGETGEIVVKGPNVMKGYLNQPEATAEAMRDGWFHTGDMGKRDEEGYFYILDRKKDMVIVAGLNVYPREVEEVLLTHPKVSEACVISSPDRMKGEVPKAFIVLKDGTEMSEREVINHCRKHLADFKVPRHVEFRESFPKTPTGKVLKRALR